MKISIWIPKDRNIDNIIRFLKDEITEAENIKSKSDRKQVKKSLHEILIKIRAFGVGICVYSDENGTTIEKYEGKSSLYTCGREWEKPNREEIYNQLLICFDANNLYIGEYNGANIKQILHKESLVPRKHGKGGQSEQRFKRARKQALIHWYKKICELIKMEWNNRDIQLGCHSIYSKKIRQYLEKQIALKIINEVSVSIDDNCLWELIGVSRYS